MSKTMDALSPGSIIGLAGSDTVWSNLAAGYGDDRYRVSPLLRRHLARGGA